MADSRTSSGRAAHDSPNVGRPSESATASSDPVDKSFEEHFGETGELQDRVVLDRSIIVDRDGATVLTDNPRPGDVPQGVAQRKAAAEEAKKSDG